MASKEDIEAIRALVDEILNNYDIMNKRKNSIEITSGIVSKVSGQNYTVTIQGKDIVIKSQLNFSIGQSVGVLVNTKTNNRYLLG
nr:MAG TPA: hypothetical protein [Bacteriophage sp.]